ncbi:MAG TPA: hypothetical protein HPP94_09290 [Desulfuromonadales bacterium]|nr:hypothetical protein [Desulfuromonadales bacterium]
MISRINTLLFDTSLDLRLSVIDTGDLLQFVVTSRLGAPRISLGLLFGIPAMILLYHAFTRHGMYLLLAPIFCPPLLILSLLFGLTRQSKIFIPSHGKAVKSVRLLWLQWQQEVPLPGTGELITYKTLSSWESDRDCYFYCLEVRGVKGLGFSIARNEHTRDEVARSLSGFLGYTIQNLGEQRQRSSAG